MTSFRLYRITGSLILFIACAYVRSDFAQPVVPGQVVQPSWQSQDINLLGDSADLSTSQSAWEDSFRAGRDSLYANWEVGALLGLDNLYYATSVPSTGDTFNQRTTYEDYLRTSLEFQTETGGADWEVQTELLAALRRQAFLSNLTRNQELMTQERATQLIAAARGIATNGGNPDLLGSNALSALDQQSSQYSREMEAQIEATMKEFQDAILGLDADRTTFQEQLQAAQAQFDAGLARINAYEQTVRDGISAALPNYQNFLTQSDQFYVQTCDAQNVCQTDFNQMTAAGQQFAQLLANMNQALTQGQPISGLAQQMADFMAQQEQAAISTRDTWNAQIYSNGSRLNGETESSYGGYLYGGDGDGPGSAFGQYVPTNGAQAARMADTTTMIGAVMRMLRTGDSSYLTNLLTPDSHHVVENLSGVDVCAGSLNNDVFGGYPFHRGNANVGGCVSSNGEFATFTVRELGTAVWGIWPISVYADKEEETWYMQGTYRLRDTNAEANMNLWQGYTADITAQRNNWQNNLLPAIQNWEAQAAQYRADYSAFQAEAAQKQFEFDQIYQANLSTIQTNREQYLGRMEDELHSGKVQLASLSSRLSQLEAAQQSAEKIREEAANSAIKIQQSSSGLPSHATPTLSSEFLSRANRDLPEEKISAKDLASAFQTSLNGGFATTLQRQNSEDSLKIMKDGNEALADILRKSTPPITARDVEFSLMSSYTDKVLNGATRKTTDTPMSGDDQWRSLAGLLGVSVSATGEVSEGEKSAILQAAAARTGSDLSKDREETKKSMEEYRARMEYKTVEIEADGRIKATREIASGTRQKEGTDGTKETDYEIVYSTQVVYFNGPGSIKMADGGKLFDPKIDLNKLQVDTAESQKKYYEELNNAANALNRRMAEVDKANNDQLTNANKAIQAKAAAAAMMGDLLVSTVTGGSGAVNRWVEQKGRAMMEAAFEEAVGLPGGILTNYMNGMPPHKAIARAVEDRARATVVSELDKASGLNGLGSYFLEKVDKAAANKKKHEQQSGLNALKPANWMKYTSTGQSIMNSDNIFISNFGAMMSGDPSVMLAQNMKTAMLIAGDSARTGFAKGYHQLAKWADGNNLGTLARGAEDQARIAASGAMTANEALAAKNSDSSLGMLLDEGEARLEMHREKYRKMTLGGFIKEITPTLTVLSSALSKPQVIKSEAQRTFETSLSDSWAATAGWPREFTRSMFVDGANMEEAIMAQGFSNLDAIVPGAGNQMREYLERIALKKKRREAARVKPEDIQTMGLTYAWRNAEVNKDGQVALQVVETVGAVVVNIVPGVGQAASMAMMAYMAAKQAYMGSLHGGTKGALAGALSGAASGALSMSGAPINFNISYDFDDGWGGSIGANLPIGNTGFTGGMSLNFHEGEGYTGSGINLGYKATGSNSDSAGIFGGGEYGYGGNLGLQFDRYGNFAGGSVTGNYSSTDYGFNNGTGTVSGGFRLDANGHYAGVDVNYTNSVDGPVFAGKKTSYLVGGGLSLNKDGSYGLNTTIGATLSDDYRMGFYGGGATQNSKLMWDKDGKYIGGSQNIDLQVQMQTRNQALTKVLTDINSGKLSMEEVESLQNQLNTLAGRDQANMWLDKNRNALKLAYNGISDEEADQILNGTHPTIKLEDALHKTAEFMKALNPSMKTGKSPDGILDTITGAIGDFGNFLFMNTYSDDLGYIDPSNGEWVPNTCFVKGTLVVVAPYTNGAFEKNGKYYKEIQDIRQGDIVASFDEHSGRIEFKRVLKTVVRNAGVIYKLTYADGTIVETTWNHPFYIEGYGWIKAKDLQVGMESVIGLDADNGSLTLSEPFIQLASYGSAKKAKGLALTGIEPIAGSETVYNIEVEGNHTYFVTEDMIGVHNDACTQLMIEGEHLKRLAEYYRNNGMAGKAAFLAVAAELFPECHIDCALMFAMDVGRWPATGRAALREIQALLKAGEPAEKIAAPTVIAKVEAQLGRKLGAEELEEVTKVANGVKNIASQKASNALANKTAGIAREKKALQFLTRKYPNDVVLTEQYLRDASGKIIKDATTGTARRVDFVIEHGTRNQIRALYEVTSRTADKTAQLAKTEAIRATGDVFVRNSNGELIKVPSRLLEQVLRYD